MGLHSGSLGVAPTDKLIRKTKTPAKPVKLADKRGLYLLLAPSGGR
jgi:hypothetical protein